MAQYKGKPLDKGNELLSVLQKNLSGWHLSRQKFVVLFVLAVLKIGVKSLLEIAGAFDSQSQRSSSLRRIERFLNSYEYCISVFGHFMLRLMQLEEKGLYLLLDRTEWQFGRTWVSVMMLSVSVEGISIPLYWRVCNKKGLSNQQERIDFMRCFRNHFPSLRISYLLADREFIGKEWFKYLQEACIPFVIRLKENFQVYHKGEKKPIKVYCRNVKKGQYVYKGCWQICGTAMHISVTACAGELLILGSLEKQSYVFEIYQKRWGIETLFRALKTQGFTIENSALCQPKKLEKLLFLLAFAFVWAYRTGVWLNQKKNIRICKNGHKEFSFFRYGFLYLQNALLNHAHYQNLISAVKILSGD